MCVYSFKTTSVDCGVCVALFNYDGCVELGRMCLCHCSRDQKGRPPGMCTCRPSCVSQSDWVKEMAHKYSDGVGALKSSFCEWFVVDNSKENIEHLEEKYDEFMPYVIAFGCITVFSCVSHIARLQYDT